MKIIEQKLVSENNVKDFAVYVINEEPQILLWHMIPIVIIITHIFSMYYVSGTG